MKVAVITPTIGTEYLTECLKSVQEQTYEDVVHYVFIDGAAHRLKVEDMIFLAKRRPNYKNIETISMSQNIGKGWYGHRVYAACSFLVDADIICYLDEDNWIKPNHIESLVECLEQPFSWAYSLRTIHDKDGRFLCEDNCESLGHWPVYFDTNVHHIDTSCFAIRRDVAVQIGHAWYAQWGADRKFFDTLKHYFPNFICSHEYSLSYRLDGNENSVNKEFFDRGNQLNSLYYKNKFPWKTNKGVI